VRDYTRVFYTVDDTPIVQAGAVSHYFFQTQAACQAFVDSFGGSSPGGGTLTQAAPVWFRLNAEKFCAWLNSSLVQNLGPDITADGKQMTFLESPRNQGVNSAEEKTAAGAAGQSAKASNFAGAQQLFNAFQALTTLVAVFKQDGRLRDAGIVQFAVDQVTAGKWSITEAFQYLSDNNI